MSDRSSVITEYHARVVNDNSIRNTLSLLVNALIGETGSGDWIVGDDIGLWSKRGNNWSASVTISSVFNLSVSLPFRTKDAILTLSDLTNPALVASYQSYIADSKTFTIPAYYAGRKIMLTIGNARIVKE